MKKNTEKIESLTHILEQIDVLLSKQYTKESMVDAEDSIERKLIKNLEMA